MPFSSNVVFLSLPRSFTAASLCLLSIWEIFARSYPIRTVIQFSICPSIGSQREGLFINPLKHQLGTFLPFEQKNFCKLFVNGGYNDKKSQYTAHQISGRWSLALSLMKLCTGSVFPKPWMSAFSVPQADTAMERRSRNLFRRLPHVSFQIFSCGLCYES